MGFKTRINTSQSFSLKAYRRYVDEPGSNRLLRFLGVGGVLLRFLMVNLSSFGAYFSDPIVKVCRFYDLQE